MYRVADRARIERAQGTALDGSAVQGGEVANAPSTAEAYEFHAAANFLFGLLKEAGAQFGNDYSSFVLYSAFLVASAADTLRNVAFRQETSCYAPGTLSVHSLAEMTGIPRETVRRKCLRLVEQGLILRLPNGQFQCVVDHSRARQLARRVEHINHFR